MNKRSYLSSYHQLTKLLLIALTVFIFIPEIASAQRPGWWRKRGWSDGFNGSFITRHWVKSTQTFGAVPGGSGRAVHYYTWMVDHAWIWNRHCLRIKSNSYGTVDKGGGLINTSGYGGHNLKQGWFEAATKISALNEWFWPTWWTLTPSGSNKDELDIMEYSWGNFGVKHWRHTSSGTTKKAGKDWWKGNSYIQNNLVNKFSLWAVKSDGSGTKFYKDNGQLISSGNKVDYGMQLRITSSPNRKRSGTPKNTTFPNFYVDYVNIWTP